MNTGSSDAEVPARLPPRISLLSLLVVRHWRGEVDVLAYGD